VNRQQAAFYRQSSSDWRLFEELRNRSRREACHELHYLQMATEKLAKAFLWGTRTPPRQTHVSLVQFLRRIGTSRRVRDALEFGRQEQLAAWVRGVLPLAYLIERLAPDLAGDGPNPEYPWPPDLPETAPVDYDFPAVLELETARGRQFVELIGRLLMTFETWT
jgi:hypothetical protein